MASRAPVLSSFSLALAIVSCGGSDDGDDDSANWFTPCPAEACKGGLECLPAIQHPNLESWICSAECQVLAVDHDPDAGQCQPHGPCGAGCCWITSHVIPQDGDEYFGGVCAPVPE